MGDTPARPSSSALIYSNVGELRAHLAPPKASRGEGIGRSLSQPHQDPLPPPLPKKKQLQRAESLPEQGPSHPCQADPRPRASSILYSIPPCHPRHEEGAPSSNSRRDRPFCGAKKPLSKSQSLGEVVGSPQLAPVPSLGEVVGRGSPQLAPAPSLGEVVARGSPQLAPVPSMGEVVARGSPQLAPAPNLGELTFRTADGELGQILQSPAGPGAVVLGCQAASLARLSARLEQELVGLEEQLQLLQAELVGKRWGALSILEREPCCESGDAWYFRVGITFGHSPLVLAAKVPKPSCASLGVQSSLGPHCTIQRLMCRFTDPLPRELQLPGHPGEQSHSPSGEEQPTHPVLQVLICAEVPYQTLAGFVKGSQELHRASPGHYERLACLLLLQLCQGLEHLRGQHVGQGDLSPENLLLVQCPCPPGGQQGKKEPLGLSLPRLLISSFFRTKEKPRPCSTSQEQDWSEGLAAPTSPAAEELKLGRLIYQLLHVDVSLEDTLGFRSSRLPEIPSLSIYSAGLRRLATLLLHRDPSRRVSLEQARSILQVLLWGPRQELFARSRKTLPLLQSWVEVKRALLLLSFAENSVGTGGTPGLEEWLCCQYFQGVTEHTLYQTTQALYAP